MCPCFLWGVSWFLARGEVGGCPGLGQRGGLSDLPAPSLALTTGGVGTALSLLRALQRWQLNFWSFFHLLVYNLPRQSIYMVISSPLVSLYVVAGGDICPGACTAAKGPRSWSVSMLYCSGKKREGSGFRYSIRSPCVPLVFITNYQFMDCPFSRIQRR